MEVRVSQESHHQEWNASKDFIRKTHNFYFYNGCLKEDLRLPMRMPPAVSRCLLFLIFLSAMFADATSQTATPPAQTQVRPTASGPPTLDGSGEPDPMTRRLTEQQMLKRNTQRQDQIIADSAKLLALAQELKAEVDKSNKNTLALNVVKKAEEIEKLSKSIKEKMRDGN